MRLREYLNLEEESIRVLTIFRSFKNGYGTLVVSTNKVLIANDEAYNIELCEVICSIW